MKVVEKKEHGENGAAKKLEALGVDPASISRKKASISYTILALSKEGVELPMSLSFPDVKAATEARRAELGGARMEMAGRLCFGFSPVQ